MSHQLSINGFPNFAWVYILIRVPVFESADAAWTITTQPLPHICLFRDKSDVAKMRQVGCQTSVHLEQELLSKDKLSKYYPLAMQGESLP